MPRGARQLKPLVEGRLADRVVDHLEPLAVGQPLHLGLEILLRVEDHVRGPSFACELGFVFGRHGTDDPGTAHLRDLAQQQADAAAAA
jgi:hypothetical protein